VEVTRDHRPLGPAGPILTKSPKAVVFLPRMTTFYNGIELFVDGGRHRCK